MNKSSLIPILLAFFLSFALSDPILIPLSRKKAHADYLTIPPDSPNYVRTNVSHVGLNNHLNDQYIGKVYLGENKQPFNLLFDTGSAWLWVAHKSSNKKKYFDCSASDSCQSKDRIIKLNYGQGEGEGQVTMDQVHFGNDISVQKQHFLTVTNMENMNTLMGDGILGLGFSRLSNGYPTFLDSMKEQGIIQNKVFSLYLGSDPTSNGDETGAFLLGGYDPHYMKGNFSYFTVNDSNYWAVNLKSSKMGDRLLPMPRNSKAIIDSGTSLISFPPSTIKGIFDHFSSIGIVCSIGYSAQMACDCPNSFDDFPNITLTFDGGWTATLTGKDYVTNHGGECMVGFQQLSYEDYTILGDIFMRKFYTLFDADNMQIGFAEATPYVPRHFWRTTFLISGLAVCLGLIGIVIKHYRGVINPKKRNTRLLSPQKNEIYL